MNMNIVGIAREFVQKAQRIANVAYVPREKEFMKMAKITAIGMVAIGVIGMLLTYIFGFLY